MVVYGLNQPGIHPSVVGLGNNEVGRRNIGNLIDIHRILLTPELQGPVLCASIFSGYPADMATDPPKARDNLHKYIYGFIAAILKHAFFASPSLQDIRLRNADFLRQFNVPGGLNLFMDTSPHHTGGDTLANSKRFHSLLEAHNVSWPAIKDITNYKTLDHDSPEVAHRNGTIAQEYEAYEVFLNLLDHLIRDGLNPMNNEQPIGKAMQQLVSSSFIKTDTHPSQGTIFPSISWQDYQLFIIEMIYSMPLIHNGEFGTRSANRRIYCYKRVGEVTNAPTGIGQYIRFSTLFQKPFNDGTVQFAAVRQMIFRDAHATTPSPRSTFKDLHFFSICETHRRRKIMVGVSPRYHNMQHINITLPNGEPIRTNLLDGSVDQRVKQLSGVWNLQNIPPQYSTFRYPLKIPFQAGIIDGYSNSIGILAGLCEVFNPQHTTQPFIDYDFFYEPFGGIARRDIEFKGILSNYYGYGLDEYILTRLFRYHAETPAVWEDFDMYFWNILWFDEVLNRSPVSDMTNALQIAKQRYMQTIGQVPKLCVDVIAEIEPRLISYYNVINTLYGNESFMTYNKQRAILNPPNIDMSQSESIGYHFGRLDRVDVYNMISDESVEEVHRYEQNTRNVGNREAVHRIMTCMIGTPIPYDKASNRILEIKIASRDLFNPPCTAEERILPGLLQQYFNPVNRGFRFGQGPGRPLMFNGNPVGVGGKKTSSKQKKIKRGTFRRKAHKRSKTYRKRR
jgi:hypothetical protein